jgi:sugar phosphate isomerase/epimerase
MIRKIGVRAHDFGKNDVGDIADIVEQYGFNTIQLALKKALPNIDDVSLALNNELAGEFYERLGNKNIDISVFGAYLNYGQTDEKSREDNINIFLKHIDFCKAFGARMVGTETGSLNADYSVHPDNHGEEAYSIFLKSVENMVRHAEEKNVLVAVEAVHKHIINTPKRMKRLLDDISSPNLVVIFDPVHLMTIHNYDLQDDVINEGFDLLGDKILTVHAKDFLAEDGYINIVPPGEGQLNYDLLLKKANESQEKIDILLENVEPNKMEGSKQYIEDILSEL